MNTASALTRFRMAALVTGVAALVLTGCSSSDDDSGAGQGGASATPSASASQSAGGGADASGSLAGSWVTTSGGKTVALAIADGKAGFFDSSGSTCTGTAGDEAGMQMIHLTCTNGNKDRADGMVDSVDATTLKVSWEGFGKETYTKAQGGQLPSGLPTAGLPSAVPST